MEPVLTAVVTGAHPFEVIAFHRLFRGLPGADCYVQNMQEWSQTSKEDREKYDVTLFYIMHMDEPGEGSPWYESQFRQAIEELGDTEQGIFVLHHAILAYPAWQLWSDMVGIQDRTFGFHIGKTVTYSIADGNHPITKGLAGWTMVDETYTMADAGAGSEILITADHPKSMKTIAWTRKYRNSPVFCFQSGHDNLTFSNPSFQEVLLRGIRWCAGRS